ncbi:MAG: hypothetical protein KAW67_10100, partial [Candidatus Eisenbacteria sp.]|nr:hypothetical protein [Candidatus Eisenbacteria bacterium]
RCRVSHARKTLLVALVAVIIPVTARAVTIRVPSERPTIQQGIDAAAEGDTVLVAQGGRRRAVSSGYGTVRSFTRTFATAWLT